MNRYQSIPYQELCSNQRDERFQLMGAQIFQTNDPGTNVILEKCMACRESVDPKHPDAPCTPVSETPDSFVIYWIPGKHLASHDDLDKEKNTTDFHVMTFGLIGLPTVQAWDKNNPPYTFDEYIKTADLIAGSIKIVKK